MSGFVLLDLIPVAIFIDGVNGMLIGVMFLFLLNE